MMERTKIYTALKGVRGRKPVDLAGLEQMLVRFSQLIAEQRWIKELDINPLLASEERLLALDARVVLFAKETTEAELPRLAIRPYPSQYMNCWTAKNGTYILFRPIQPEDEPLLVKFHETLSDRSVYMRYMHPMLLNERVAHDRLARICHCDYDREITIIAEDHDPETEEPRILGAGRLSKMHGMDEARFSVLVSDLYQGLGVGKELMKQVIEVGKQEKLCRIHAEVTVENQAMQHILKELGFELNPTDEPHLLKAELNLC